MSEQNPPIAVLIIHEIEDFDTFKPIYDAHRVTREAAQVLGEQFFRGADNANNIAAYLPAASEDKLRELLMSDDLRAKMKEATVKGTPNIKVMKPMSNDAILDRPLAGLIVWHKVGDIAKWREVYDSIDAKRKEMGIVGHAVGVNADVPDEVVVYHQAESVDTLKAFMASPELKEGMKAAGVTSEPEASFWNVSPAIMY